MSKQFVILARGEDNGEAGELGTRKELIATLSQRNTAPEREGEDVLYGPGIRLELPPQDPVAQALLTITEEDIGWLVLMRIARDLSWRIVDPETGRELNP